MAKTHQIQIHSQSCSFEMTIPLLLVLLSDSQPEVTFSSSLPRGHLQCLEPFLVVMTGSVTGT